MALEREQRAYVRELPRLLASEGRYALIQGDEVIEILDTYADALRCGYDRFGLEPFMVKQIQATERIHTFTRDYVSCPM